MSGYGTPTATTKPVTYTYPYELRMKGYGLSFELVLDVLGSIFVSVLVLLAGTAYTYTYVRPGVPCQLFNSDTVTDGDARDRAGGPTLVELRAYG